MSDDNTKKIRNFQRYHCPKCGWGSFADMTIYGDDPDTLHWTCGTCGVHYTCKADDAFEKESKEDKP